MRCVIVEPSGVIQTKDLDGFNDVKRALDNGYIECIPLIENSVAYVDEDGIMKQLPINPVATRVILAMLKEAGRCMLPGSVIRGKCVFLGYAYSEGEVVESSIPDSIFERYFNHG